MDKFLSFIKKHKKGLIILLVSIILIGLMIFGVYKVYSYLTVDVKKSEYGDRCEITSEIPITKERQKEIKTYVEGYEDKLMKVVTVDPKCNLIDIVIKVPDDMPISKVKEMSKGLLNVFNEEELRYYEIELMVDSDKEESEVYPIMGKRRKEIDGESINYFVWSE